MPAAIAFDNTYARELPGAYVAWKPATVPAPRWLFANHSLADELGLDPSLLEGADGAARFAGNALPEGAQPIAQAYAGHQFGGFSPRLGDGRALLLGEVIDRHGRRRDLAFKGSGRTPFSRGGDGKAAVGPMLREVIVGESMHALGIPTTRALAVVATGEPVFREQALPGAVLTRVAASHLRVGTFQFFAARDDRETLARLLDYAIARHDPALSGLAPAERPFALLRAVAARQAALIAQWMSVGFIHGVMNTDNMTISGETIDYGPCAFMEAYDPQAVFSSIDHHGRYAYRNQPAIAQWNLARLAEALLPLAADPADAAAMDRAVADATAILDAFPSQYRLELRARWRAKLGLDAGGHDDSRSADADAADDALADDFLALLERSQVDFTLGFRRLADAAAGDEAPLRALFADPQVPQAWLARWHARCPRDDSRAARLRAVNPIVIARNHRVEEALAAAQQSDDLGPFERLLAAVRRPFDDAPDQQPYTEPAPAEVTARYQTFCGT